MPIRAFLEGHQFEPETIRVMGLGFEMTMVALRLSDRDDVSKETVARKIIALAQAGERNADRLCDYALGKLRDADGRSSQLFQSSSEARAAVLKPRRQI